MPTVIPTRCREHPIGGGGEFTAPGRMERMTVLDRASARRSVDALTAIGFGVLASAPEPGLFMVLLTGIAAIAIGLWSRGLPAGLGGLAVLVVVSMARATWLDGHWLYVAEEVRPACVPERRGVDGDRFRGAGLRAGAGPLHGPAHRHRRDRNRALVQGSARGPGRTGSAGRREHGPGHVARRALALRRGGVAAGAHESWSALADWPRRA